MKLKIKLSIVITFMWLVFLALNVAIATLLIKNASVSPIPYLLTAVFLLSFIFTALTLTLLHYKIFKTLEKIQKSIAETLTKSQGAVREKEKNELTILANQVNQLIEIANHSKEIVEKNVLERTKDLELANVQLHQEITEHRLIERELIIHKEHLVRLAHYDGLTSLPNRVFFNEILNKALNQAKRHNKLLAVLFINLDEFKKVNENFEHRTGDLILKEIANRFIGILRAGDIIARLGGDEFIILLNDVGQPKFAGPVAEKIIQACMQPIKIDTANLKITASIGIAIYPNDGESLEDLEKNADVAMYKAKQAGGNTYQYYRQEMHIAVHENIKFETALRDAIKNNEFLLYFQPQLSLATGAIQSIEALIRWQHPELGLLGPDKFIPIAEETGLIMPIGEWALHEACRINKKWQDSGYDPLVVAVNISPKQFHHQDVAGIIKDALFKTNLAANYLQIEITETAVMDNVDIVIAKLHSIHQMGVSIAIDDFGTGYTSINYLKNFPVNILKIDQTFIKGIPHKQNDIAITSTIISLGHNLGLEVVAEGVETTEQMRFLAEHGCDIIQGYFLSRPLNENKIKLQFSRKGKVKDKIVQK